MSMVCAGHRHSARPRRSASGNSEIAEGDFNQNEMTRNERPTMIDCSMYPGRTPAEGGRRS